MSHLTLHRDPDRYARLATDAERPILYDPVLGSWIVTNPETVTELMRQPQLRVAHVFEDLSEELRTAFPNLAFAFRCIPLCMNGEAHRHMRRRMAEVMGANRAAVEGVIRRAVEIYVGRLESCAEIDLVSDVLRPLGSEVVAAVSGSALPAKPEFDRLSIVLDQWISLKHRRAVEETIQDAREIIRSQLGPDDPPDEEGARLALHILGRDALVGTLGESLHRILQSAPQTKLSEIDYPAMPPETGVPFAERRVGESFEYRGYAFQAGERVRFRLQGLVYSEDPADRDRIFGIGVHTCLGRQIGIEVWSHLTARLMAIERVAEIAAYRVRTGEYTFTFPELLRIRMS